MDIVHDIFRPQASDGQLDLLKAIFRPRCMVMVRFLPARRRPQGLVIIGVCLCALFLSARYLKNGFMDHHQIWWVGPGGEPVEQVQFWC